MFRSIKYSSVIFPLIEIHTHIKSHIRLVVLVVAVAVVVVVVAAAAAAFCLTSLHLTNLHTSNERCQFKLYIGYWTSNNNTFSVTRVMTRYQRETFQIFLLTVITEK